MFLKSCLCLVFPLLFSSFYPLNTAEKLIIEVDNIKIPEGIIWVGIYDSAKNYMIKEKAIVEGFDVRKTGSLELEIPIPKYGTYAVALFHDINGNGELDRNFIGIPSEPYAFSQRPKTKWRLPRFEEIKFDFYQNDQILKTKLKKWWDKK